MLRKLSAFAIGITLMVGLVALPGLVEAKAVVKFWNLMTNPERLKGMEEVIAQFEKENPDIKIEMTPITWGEAHVKYMAAVGGGNPPEIGVESYGWPITYSQMGILEPVDDVIKDLGGTDNLKASALKNRYYEGQYWGVPLYGTPTVLVYRKDVLKAKGLKVPDTWGELLETVKKAHDPANDFYGFMVMGGLSEDTNVMVWCFMSNNGATVFNKNRPVTEDDVVFDSKETREVYELLAKLHEYSPPGSETMTSSEQVTVFPAGKVFGFIHVVGAYAYIRQLAPPDSKMYEEKTAMAKIPYGPSLGDNPRSGLYNDVGLILFKGAKHTKEAKKFVKFLLRDDVYVKFLTCFPYHMWPVTFSADPLFLKAPVMQDHPEAVKLGLEVMPTMTDPAAYYGATPFWGELETKAVFAHVLQRVIIDKWSVDRAVSEGGDMIRKIVREFREMQGE